MKNKISKRIKRKNEFRYHQFFNVTKNRKIRHPTYIWRQRGNIYDFHSITHSFMVDGKMFIELRENPNPKDKRKSFYNPKSESDLKSSFGRKLKKWKINELDSNDIHKK